MTKCWPLLVDPKNNRIKKKNIGSESSVISSCRLHAIRWILCTRGVANEESVTSEAAPSSFYYPVTSQGASTLYSRNTDCTV